MPRIARAMAMENRKGNTPLYLDMSAIPEHLRDYFIQSKVKWMDNFFRKLGDEAKTDMFGKTPYYALNQMTKMGIRTGADCRSDVPGLLSAGLAQSGCANHFAGFHIGLCVGNGWIAGRSAIEDLDRMPAPALDQAEVRALHAEARAPLNEKAKAESDRILRDLQGVMFAYDIGILKREDRLTNAQEQVLRLSEEFKDIAAPHTHELVRLKETEAMLLAARFILGASLYRTESRLSHFREDHDAARRRQLAGLGRRGGGRQRAGLQQDADPDAVLFGDAAAAETVAADGAPVGRWRLSRPCPGRSAA